MEAAGLALAVLPLVTSTTENWRRLYGTTKVILRPREKDEKLADDLQRIHLQVEMLEVILHTLIQDLSLLPDEMRQRLLDLDTDAWKDPTVDQALTQKLGQPGRDAFVDCMELILQTLDSIISDKTLRLLKTDLVPESPDGSRPIYSKLIILRKELGKSNEGLKGLKDRISYTSSRNKRRKAFNQLKEFTATLQDLTKAKDLKGMRPTANATRKSSLPDAKSRKLIQNAYNAMARLWSCSCHPPHEARLCLKRRLNCFDDPSISSLELWISSEKDPQSPRWHEGNVALDASPETRLPSPVKVRFENNEPTRGRRRSSASLSSRKSIQSICELIDEAHLNNATLEMVFDNESLWQIQAQRKRKIIRESQTGRTLGDMLRNARTLSLKDKRILAVLIANALLDFSGSKWCASDWNKDNISFFESLEGGVDIKRPFLSTNFDTEADTSTANRSMFVIHPCPPLLALGVVLLELEMVEVIEKMRKPSDMVSGKINENTDLFAAQRILEESMDNIYEGYKGAVTACLKCEWNLESDASASFDDEEFRQYVYDNVVAPLEEELKNGFRLTLEKLEQEL